MISFGHADPKVVRKMQRIHVAFCQLILKLIHASRGNAVQGGELSYMTLAMEREQTAYSSLLPLTAAVPADPEPTPLRLVRGCITMPFTAC